MAALPRELEVDLGTAPERAQDGEFVDVLTLLRLRDRMKQQLMEYSAAIHNSQANFLDHISEEKLNLGAQKDLQADIEEIEVSLWNKMLALQRIQLMDALRNKVNQGDNDSCRILETLKCIVLLSQKIVKYQKQAQEKEQQLIEIKKKRLLLKKDKEQKLQQIQTKMKKQNEQGSMSLNEIKMLNNFEKESKLTTIIQNVFQNIIIGSRINWAEDPSLKAIVLQLEKKDHLK